MPGGAAPRSRAISISRPRSGNRSAPPCSNTGRIIECSGGGESGRAGLADQFNRNPVDPGKTNEAIERLVDARSDLTRTLTQLSLKLRLVLTEQQWQELQRRRPGQGNESAPPPEAPIRSKRYHAPPIHLVDLRSHDKIAFGEPANLVGVNLHVHLAPRQAQIRMVAFGFRHGADAIHEIESRFEIRKRKTLREVMLFDNLPVRQLFGKWNQLRALQRRHASPARDAMFFSQLAHGILSAIVHWHLHPQRVPKLDTATPLKFVKGVGPARAEMLEAKGLVTVEDLLAYAPFRYEDRTNVKTIAQLAPGEMATVIAEVQSAHLRGFRRRNLGLFEAIFKDASKERLLAKWFHGGYLVDRFLPGSRVALYGKVELDSYTGDLLIMHPEFEILTADDSDGDAALHTGRIVAVYEAAGKVTTRAFRSLMHRVLESIEPLEDHLPPTLRERLKLPDLWTAIRALHFPAPDCDLRMLNAYRTPAHWRLIFEEFFWLECGLSLKRSKARLQPGISFELNDRVREKIKADAALQAHRRAKARTRRNRAGHAGAASHEPAVARRRGQRQNAGGGRGRGDRDRKRLSGRGAGAY